MQREVPAHPMRTVTVTETEIARAESPPGLTLQLGRRQVRWSDDTHDNENDGKRSSKSCCIYHKPRRFDESSTESSEDESSDGESNEEDNHLPDCHGSEERTVEHEGARIYEQGADEGESSEFAKKPRHGRRRRRPERPSDPDNGNSSSSDGGPVRPRRSGRTPK
jgi:hypothetical protein